MTEGLAIRLREVVKRYGEITAVNHLDLDVPTGTCVGLLGPNGAGKSTTMRMLTAQAIADEGELEVLGFSLPRDSKQARAECGVVPQLDNLDVTLTVEQNLLVFSHLYRIGRHDRHEAIERSLVLANLVDRRDTRVDKLSGGMRRRLLIARALVHQPRLVLMDEPTVGLDPQVRQQLWALIDQLRSEGTTILMSTHYIEEAQRLADTVLIMSHGEGVARGKPSELVVEHAGSEVLEVYGPPTRLAEVESEAGAAGLKTRRTGTSVSVLGLDGRNGFGGFEGDPQAGEPRRRLRPAHRRGDRLMATAARTAKIGRLERPAITGVLVREVVNFSSYWRAATFSSTVEPTIYLLAFGFGFGSLVSTINGVLLRRVRRYGDSGDGRALLVCLRGDVRNVRQVPVPAHLRRDPRRAGRHGGARHGRVALDRLARRRLWLRADDRRDLLRARPGLGDAHGAVHRLADRASAGPTSGS